uniref:JmjC domain-containing protein n=1 Tax=Panagrolaimus sp. JU765 TaxID=591449 RepID=A0AC34QG25_9BILA
MEAEFEESPSSSPPLTIKIKRSAAADENGSINFDLAGSLDNNNLSKVDAEDHEHECAKCHNTVQDDSETTPESPHDKDIQWVQCDACNLWFHIDCVGLEGYEVILLDFFNCDKCSEKHGPSKDKQPLLNHRYNFDDIEEENLPSQVGTKDWIKKFVETEDQIPSASEEIMPVFQTGTEFMEKFNREAVWDKVYKIINKDGLGLRLPDDNFNIDELESIVNKEESIETIDVYMQQSCRMKLKTFFAKWRETYRPRLYNMLSFEFTHSKLMDVIGPPDLMYELSWVHRIWQFHDGSSQDPFRSCLQKEHKDFRPDVAMFCLLGMGGSYTDFHIDFGGSSVWYHVFKGQKIFYILPPTDENLNMFSKWTMDEKHTETFLGDMVPDSLTRVVINPGETVMIPSGYIHAVYTPVDSIVFGGNFLHELNIEMQLKVYEMENEANYETNFMFPHFELVNWYAAVALFNVLSVANDDDRDLPNCMITGLTSLYEKLKIWMEKDKKQKIETHDYFSFLLTDLKKELKIYKRRQNKEESKSPSPKRKLYSRNNSFQDFEYLMEEGMDTEENWKITKGGTKERHVKKPKKPKTEKVVSKKDTHSLTNMFAAKTTGRRPKPTARVLENVAIETAEDESTPSKDFFAGFSKEERECIAEADAIGARDAIKLGDDPYSSEDDETVVPKKRKKPVKVESRKRQECQKKTPKLLTAKQRLAKKLKMKY